MFHCKSVLSFLTASAFLAATPSFGFTAICIPHSNFDVDLETRTVRPPLENSSDLMRDLIDGFRAASVPSRIIVSFDPGRSDGAIIFEGAMRREGRVLDVWELSETQTAVTYVEAGKVDGLKVSETANGNSLFVVSENYPLLTVHEYACEVSD